MAIDRKKIIADLSHIEIENGANGLIEEFNVLVNQLPVKFWNSFADRITAKTQPDMIDSIEYLLVNAGHECGYHTGWGIINSEEWKAVVEPMIEKVPEDILHGAFAVFTAWGWANIEIVELIPGEKMVARAYDYYESDVITHGQSTRPKAFMLRGICGAFMDLAYGGPYDSTGKQGIHTFACEQVKGIEMGDDYGEFIVTKVKE